MCHCEERGDEAISIKLRTRHEIASRGLSSGSAKR